MADHRRSGQLWHGEWKLRTGAAGKRDSYLYLPKSKDGNARLPLMVMLHGCTQDPENFAIDTGMNLLAEKYGFAVLYPQQQSLFNPMKCWNWFMPESQKRESGELAIVVEMVRDVQQSVPIDPDRVFVTGLSAGAALAMNLVACYADLFAGAGIHTGVEYMGASNLEEAYTALSSGARGDLEAHTREAVRESGRYATVPAVVLIHGTADERVHPSNTQRLIAQLGMMHNLLEGRDPYSSLSLTPISMDTFGIQGGYTYTSENLGKDGVPRIQNVVVQGLAHAWSGAYRRGNFADPKGPNAAELIWQFLSKNYLRR